MGLLGPVEFGVAGESWETAYKVTRIVASGDGPIGQLLGYHCLWAWVGAAGFVDKKFVATTYGTLNLPAIQLVFVNFYLGIARGGFEAAVAFSRDKTRAWPYGGGTVESAHDEWYILEGYGTLQARLWAAGELANSAGAEISALLHAPRENLTPEARGHAAVRIAAAKQLATDISLEVGNRIFELTGARASANSVGLDICWPNARTHTLHDPVSYKRREAGRYTLLSEIPEPTWYTQTASRGSCEKKRRMRAISASRGGLTLLSSCVFTFGGFPPSEYSARFTAATSHHDAEADEHQHASAEESGGDVHASGGESRYRRFCGSRGRGRLNCAHGRVDRDDRDSSVGVVGNVGQGARRVDCDEVRSSAHREGVQNIAGSHINDADGAVCIVCNIGLLAVWRERNRHGTVPDRDRVHCARRKVND